MNDTEQLRYSRHLLLEQFDFAKQELLATARVLIIGMGGLGCPAALYLAASGVGQLVLADGDQVDLTNLQRQILHNELSIGQKKVLSAFNSLQLINSSCKVSCIEQCLSELEINQHVANVDVVLDCSDNFTTRQLVNQACVRYAKPLISGAATRFAGQLTVFDRRQPDAPCYNCLFPASSDADIEQCATMGVFAPLTGIIGTMQAAEAIKIITNIGTSLNGYLLLYDALDIDWRKISLARDQHCTVCG